MMKQIPTVYSLENNRRYIVDPGPSHEDRFVVDNYVLRHGYTSSIGPVEVLEAVKGGKRFVIVHTIRQQGRAISPVYVVEYVSAYEDGNFVVNYETYLSLNMARIGAQFCAASAYGDATQPVKIIEVA